MTSPDDTSTPGPGGRPTRRTLLKATGVAAAGALLSTGAAGGARGAATASRDILTRTVGRTGEKLPAVGLGTFMTFDKRPGARRGHLREVMRRYWSAGGRVVDTSPLYGGSEISVGDFANDLGITGELFVANKSWATGDHLGDESHMVRQLATSRTRLWRDRIDLMQVHNLVNAEAAVPVLQRWKKSGEIRHVGVTHHVPAYYPAVENLVRTLDVDFIQVRYSIFMRAAEERLLPLAAERGVGVMINMALEKARLHKLVEGRALPGFARDLGITTWAAFFLKYVLSHPAVTVVLPATTNPDHVRENMAALSGPLPDAATRRSMVRHMESIPGFTRLESMPWYPGKTFDGYVKLG